MDITDHVDVRMSTDVRTSAMLDNLPGACDSQDRRPLAVVNPHHSAVFGILQLRYFDLHHGFINSVV